MKKISRTLTETEIEETHGIAGSILRKVFHLSRHEISRLKFSGQILLDEQRIHVNDIAHAGSVLTVVFPEDHKMEQFISCAEPKILYEDEDFIAADKPSGIPVHAGHGHLDDSLGTALICHYGRRNQEFLVRCIGRLDREVSGAVLYAKNQPAAARLSRERTEGILHKEYTALIHGHMPEAKGIISGSIVKKAGQRRREVSDNGKEARTHYAVLQEYQSFSLVRIWLETGRTHQIRVHFSDCGHPLLGDELYGGDSTLISRTALHCARIDLISPFSGEQVSIASSLPEDMADLLLPAGIPEDE